jgi:glucose-6-phosphate 1-dehydrogenase
MNTPTIFVIFGATGDLAFKKLFPALYHLHQNKLLPERFKVIGVARRPIGDTGLREIIEKSLFGKDVSESFLDAFTYVQGVFDTAEMYTSIQEQLEKIDAGWGQCSNKLFYLAVPPSLYKNILTQLSASKLTEPCGGEFGWTRVLIEKPFGEDVPTAEALDKLLAKLFKEEQIFRIDHYLAKETLQNILAFRFSNSMFEPMWNREHIELVEINLFEKNGVEDRGDFYDAYGALKDVGQNHLLQMLSLVAMEKPLPSGCREMRDARAEIVRRLRVYPKSKFVRAQYEGYKEIEGVNPQSNTETYFSMNVEVRNKRWKGVSFRLTAGKALLESKVEIKIHFKDSDPSFFISQQHPDQEKNTLTFRIQPEEGISLLLWVKVPGFENKIEQKKLSFKYQGGEDSFTGRQIDAYEKVLFDTIVGDQALFASTEEVVVAWNFISKILGRIADSPLKTYAKGTDGKLLLKELTKEQ